MIITMDNERNLYPRQTISVIKDGLPLPYVQSIDTDTLEYIQRDIESMQDIKGVADKIILTDDDNGEETEPFRKDSQK